MSPSKPRRETTATARATPLGRGDLAESLLYIFPLFLVYQIGVMFSASPGSTINGADFVTRAVFAAVGGDRLAYLAVHLAFAAAFLVVVLVLGRRRPLRVGDGLPMVLESAIYALTLGSLIIVVMEKLLHLSISPALIGDIADFDLGSLELGPTGNAIVSSIGAGVYEELVFRLGLFVGLALIFTALGVRTTLALLASAVIASVVFSLAHHIGPFGEPFAARVFVYRALAGLAFTAIFYFRSLAHAVYAHFLYDVYVLVIL